MRILFTFAGGSGHLDPLLPIARASQSAGHTIAFAGRPWMVPIVEKLGFHCFPSGSDHGLTPQRLPLLPLDAEREDRGLAGFAGRVSRQRAADLLPLCREWQPDLLVCEEVDFGAMVVAERLGLPYATVLVIAAGSFVRPSVVAGPLNEVRREYDLPPDNHLALLRRYLVLSPFPPGFRDPAFPLPPNTLGYRLFGLKRQESPAWISHPDERPLVYFTLGTIYNMESGDLFQRVLAGLQDLPIRLIVTVGRDLDPAELGPQSENVRIERFIPQGKILPYCDLVVSHCGSGSVAGALAHGLPMVLIPMGADQPYNAARCVELGIGKALDPVEATPESVRAAARAVLRDSSYRRAAQQMQAEMNVLTEPVQAVKLLERLSAEKTTIFPL